MGWKGDGLTPGPLTYLCVFKAFRLSDRHGGACRLLWDGSGVRTEHQPEPSSCLAQLRPGALGRTIRAADSPPCGAPTLRTAQTVLTSLHPSDLFLETTFIDGPLREEHADLPALTGCRERHERAAASSLNETHKYYPVDVCTRSTRRSSVAVGVRRDSRRQRRIRKRLVMSTKPFLFSLFIAHHSPTCRDLTWTTLEKRGFQTRFPRRRSAYPSGSFFPDPPRLASPDVQRRGRSATQEAGLCHFFRVKNPTVR